MALLYLQRPLRFDPGQHGHDLVIAQHAVVDRHGGAIVRLVDELGKAMLGDGKSCASGWCQVWPLGSCGGAGSKAIRSAITPVGLAFALGAVAGDTVLSVCERLLARPEDHQDARYASTLPPACHRHSRRNRGFQPPRARPIPPTPRTSGLNFISNSPTPRLRSSTDRMAHALS